MEKIIKIDNIGIRFKNTSSFLIIYKEQFGKDVLRDIFNLKNIVELNTKIYYNIIWTLAKTADRTIEPPEDWINKFNKLSLIKIIPEIMEMILLSLVSSKTKPVNTEDSDFKPTVEIILSSAIKRGLLLGDFDQLTVGMLIDYIDAYDDREDERALEATQTDFDEF